MTKSEAKAIAECTDRALRSLQSQPPWPELGKEMSDRIYAYMREACEEIQRVRDMALAELGKRR